MSSKASRIVRIPLNALGRLAQALCLRSSDIAGTITTAQPHSSGSLRYLPYEQSSSVLGADTRGHEPVDAIGVILNLASRCFILAQNMEVLS